MNVEKTACEYLDGMKISDEYKQSLKEAVRCIYKRDVTSIHNGDNDNLIEWALGKMRYARSKAKFDDLYILEYANFEFAIISMFRCKLWRNLTECNPWVGIR